MRRRVVAAMSWRNSLPRGTSIARRRARRRRRRRRTRSGAVPRALTGRPADATQAASAWTIIRGCGGYRLTNVRRRPGWPACYASLRFNQTARAACCDGQTRAPRLRQVTPSSGRNIIGVTLNKNRGKELLPQSPSLLPFSAMQPLPEFLGSPKEVSAPWFSKKDLGRIPGRNWIWYILPVKSNSNENDCCVIGNKLLIKFDKSMILKNEKNTTPQYKIKGTRTLPSPYFP